MYPARFLELAVLSGLATVVLANNNSAYGFTANIFQVFDGVILGNHPAVIGYPQARNHVIQVNPQADDPQTLCPTKVQVAGQCPTPTPTNVLTQFNTTLDQGGPMGEVYMNVAVPGGQQLYVEQNGLVRYTHPYQEPPAGSYTDLFNLVQHFDGSQLQISNPALLFNNTLYFYSCQQPSGLNITYAQTPAANVTSCLGFSLLSDAVWLGSGVPACPRNPSTDEHGNFIPSQCGYAAYQYD
ncbi:hypothetical protein EV356DRAFT_577010 [Viridothelium virens]|uniref:Uncharacterized protein n=1 Tax=Viridothelium virens TaxID=1048519 RepID=A0A6A6H8V1_VIRVR|nr:hypothetical protein EV356DRAFT_577010 [Viridothelium virens]